MLSSIFDRQPLQGDQLHVVRNLQQASVWMLARISNEDSRRLREDFTITGKAYSNPRVIFAKVRLKLQ